MKNTATKKPRKETKSNKLCIQSNCKSPSGKEGYCRLHYLANWKHIQFNKHIKAERRLNAYVDKLAKKYPADYMERIKEGLEDESKFMRMVEELDLEQTNDAPETEKEYLEKFVRVIKPE